MRSDVCRINEWFLKHNLRLNFSKTKFIVFFRVKSTGPKLNMLKIHSPNCNSNNDSYNVTNKTDNIRHLKITVDQYIKWDIHVNNRISKMRKHNYFYINARKILDKQILRMVYFTTTQSILQNGITAWGGLGIVVENNIL